MVVFLIFLVVGLVLLHMAKPRFKKHLLSSAAFFRDLPEPRNSKLKIRIGNPFKSPAFYPRFLAALLVLLAVWRPDLSIDAPGRQQDGVWILVDSGQGMSTENEGTSRFETARDIIAAYNQETQNRPPSTVRLSLFDQERVDLGRFEQVDQILAVLEQRRPRDLPTNLALVRAAARAALEDETGLIIVICDDPAPIWLADQLLPIRWIDLGGRTANVGFSDINAVRDPFTGQVTKLSVQIAARGDQRARRLAVQDDQGTQVYQQELSFAEDSIQTVFLDNPQPGRFHFQLSPADAFTADDQLTITIPENRTIRVDWQLRDKTWPQKLGLQPDDQRPMLKVTRTLNDTADSSPTIVLGDGYDSRGRDWEIRDFQDGSPLLKDLDLDTAESFSISGRPLPDGFTPILRGTDGLTRIAYRNDPATVWLPGLPLDESNDAGRFSTTLFFNAVRLLLRERRPDPLFHLTSLDHPFNDQSHVGLWPEEGDGAREPISANERLADTGLESGARRQPLTPFLLLAALCLIALERCLAT